MTAQPKRGYLQFDCGARSVTFNLNDAIDSFELFSLREQKRRKKDGRYSIVVFDSAGYPHNPTFEDGRRAPCLSCPCRRSSGRKQIDAMPEPERSFRVMITCYPQEVYVPGQVSDGSDSSPSATADVAGATPRVAECPPHDWEEYTKGCNRCGAPDPTQLAVRNDPGDTTPSRPTGYDESESGQK